MGYNVVMQVVFYRTAAGRKPVPEFIVELGPEDQARFAEVKAAVESHGLQAPRVIFRQLDGKLWEIKFRGPGGGFRIAYVVLERDLMIWLHAFRKTTRKTSRKDLEVARKRLKEVLES